MAPRKTTPAKTARKPAAARTAAAKKAAPRKATPTKAAAKKRAARRRAFKMRTAKFSVGQVVRHRVYPFRGIIFDIDPVFNNTEEWWLSIPEEIRPRKDQPYYHLLAENAETEYIAYVSEQNLLADNTREPLRHPQVGELFTEDDEGHYHATFMQPH